MTRHRFINDARSPIPMGSTADYTCTCGKRGTYETIERHITESNLPAYARDVRESDGAPTAPHNQLFDQVIERDHFGGDTMAHYLPNEPRKPAPTGESQPLTRPNRPGTPEPLPPPPSIASADGLENRPRSIAELFQDMLRSAFQAGTAAITTGDSFETWYQREVLQ